MSKAAHVTFSESPDATGTSPNTIVTNLFVGGVLNLALVLLLAQACWYLVFSPEGPMRLYTPNVGVSFVITILMVIHWAVDVFDYWPFNRRWLNETPAAIRGAVLLTTYILVGFFVMFVFYYQMLGMYGPVFFSGPGLLSGGGLGQYPQTATENACFAQVMMNTSIIFFTMLWITALGFRPWASLGRFARGLGVFFCGAGAGNSGVLRAFLPAYRLPVLPGTDFHGCQALVDRSSHDHEQPVSLRLDRTGTGAAVLDELTLGRPSVVPYQQSRHSGCRDDRLGACSGIHDHDGRQHDHGLVVGSGGFRRRGHIGKPGLALESYRRDGHVLSCGRLYPGQLFP